MGRTRFAMPACLDDRGRIWPLVALSWLVTTASLAGDEPARPAEAAIRGRVVDERGKPVAGARVRLYRRASRWDRRNVVAEEMTAGPDGAFRLATRPELPPPPRAWSQPRLVLVADHTGLAVGWRIIPDDAATFAGDVTLTTASAARTVAVIDADGRPVAGALVAAYGLVLQL